MAVVFDGCRSCKWGISSCRRCVTLQGWWTNCGRRSPGSPALPRSPNTGPPLASGSAGGERRRRRRAGTAPAWVTRSWTPSWRNGRASRSPSTSPTGTRPWRSASPGTAPMMHCCCRRQKHACTNMAHTDKHAKSTCRQHMHTDGSVHLLTALFKHPYQASVKDERR